ncbi:growth/differentiation factor 10 [Saccoglossus kowalevskii]|uniref:Bone morphogenetic protein 3 n=1 Tax=Saccoglossus kowalevskii TaxID=10224 RepID=A0ABM0GR01_SACKO|nr:PREDICTED: bone morphogenetic protein 3 [Saccoglossus kowalevskii]
MKTTTAIRVASLCVLIFWATTCQTHRLDGDKVVALQETLKQLLRLPEYELDDKANFADRPPRHMVHLLEHLSRAREWSDDAKKWNTIRTVRAKLGPGCGLNNVYNVHLPSLPVEETLLSVQFHFYKVKTDLRKEEFDEKLKLDILQKSAGKDSQCRVTKSLNVPLPSYGWQIADITNAIEFNTGDIKLGAQFRVENNLQSKMTNHTSSLYRYGNRFLRHANPFVLVFAKDLTLKETERPIPAESDPDSSGYYTNASPDVFNDGNLTVAHRNKRSIHTYALMTNEYPEVVDEETMYNNMPDTFPKFTERNRKKQSKKRTRRVKSKRKHTKTLLEKQRQKNRKKEEDEQDQYTWKLCGRHVMRVDFQLIGWNAYVISPKSFDAFYCSGECPFPMTKELNPSNHAAVQSIVHALDAVKGVPPPCCVPDKLSPLSILYFDESRNVVLKVYPNMVVDTCACR